MNVNRGKYLAGLLCAALAIPVVMFAPGCTEECVDRFDCRAEGDIDELVCVEGKCVPAPPVEEEDGGVPDAGEMDAGEMDAGEMDAGEMDAGEMDAGEMDAGMMDAGMTQAFVATLTGEQEVPANPTTDDGQATFTLGEDQGDGGFPLTYNITHDVNNVSAAHIHRAHAGLNGPVTHPLTAAFPTMTGTVTLSAQDVADLEAGLLYVNLHVPPMNAQHIRGQITRPGERLYSAILDGGTNGTGAAQFIVNAAGDSLKYDVTLFGVMGVTAANIREKLVGTAIVPLANVMNSGGSGTVAVDAADLLVLDADGSRVDVEGAASTVILTGDTNKLQ